MQHFLCVLIFVVGSPALAAEQQTVLNVWPGKPPGEKAILPPEADQTKPEDKLIAGKPVIRLGSVSTPQVAIFRPQPEKNTGTAVVVLPGGGHKILAYDLEGTEVAAWLNSIGVTAVVLKYRVPGRDPEKPGLAPLQDAQRAISLVRSRAKEWGIQPNRVGVCGFSAGGTTAAAAALSDERKYEAVDDSDKQSCRPDFAILVYPGGFLDKDGKLKLQVAPDKSTPPMFLVHAMDDHVPVENSLLLASAVRKAGASAEVHTFARGGHGYGLRPGPDAVTRWPVRAAEWLHEQGLLHSEPVKKSGNPLDDLPPHIRPIAAFGERADFSPDSRRVLFLSKQYGDVMEYDMLSGKTRCLSLHFKHYGFNRAMYLSNGDILLTGPIESFDVASEAGRAAARSKAYLMVLDQGGKKSPVLLGGDKARTLAEWIASPKGDPGEVCAEGPAPSRRSLTLAWTQTRILEDKGPGFKKGESQIFTGKVVYKDGVPHLAEKQLVLESKTFPKPVHSFEVQNFVPPNDDKLTVTVYQLGLTTNSETFLFDLKTKAFENVSKSPDHYEECEGIFPDGKSTTVERGESGGKPWPLVDAHRLWLDGSGKVERLTHFTAYPGFKATNYVVSDDGRWMAFQLGKAGDEAGAGYGILLYSFERAKK